MPCPWAQGTPCPGHSNWQLGDFQTGRVGGDRSPLLLSAGPGQVQASGCEDPALAGHLAGHLAEHL